MQGRCAGSRSGVHGGICGQLYLHIGAGFYTGSGFQSDLQYVLAFEKSGRVESKNSKVKSREAKVEVKKSDQNNQTAAWGGNGVIVVKNLTKKFGDNVVLDNISLTIEKGKTTVVIGPSGCGKTVLIKNFIVLLRPSSGEVYFKDRRIDNLPDRELNEIRTHYGFLFQGGALFDSLSVAENIMFPIRQHYKMTDWRQVEDVPKDKQVMFSQFRCRKITSLRSTIHKARDAKD